MKVITIIAALLAPSITAAQARSAPARHVTECNVLILCAFTFNASRHSSAPTKHLRHQHRRARQVRLAPAGRVKDEEPVHTLSEASRGVVRSISGATAYVASRAAGAFQCVVSALEHEGYPVRFMGGWARSGHMRNSLHYSGLALDINQVARGVTRPRMPSNESALAAKCGLVSGAQWTNNDSGHFQLGGWSGHRHHKRRHRHH